MDIYNRAVRRHHVSRLKYNRKIYWGHGRCSYSSGPMTPKQQGKVVQYPAVCSCTMCGNPRHKLKGKKCLTLTIQEQRQVVQYEYELAELSISATTR